MVQHPAARVVLFFGGDGAGCRQVLERVEQRQLALGKVGFFHRPIIHLGVDVVGILAVPGRIIRLVPQALQVGRLAAGAAGGDHQVTAELEQQRHQLWIAAGGEGADAFIGGKRGGGRRAQVQRHAVEQALEVGYMLGAQGVEAGAAHRGQHGIVTRLGVGGDVLVVLEIGGARQNQGGGVGVRNGDLPAARSTPAAYGLNHQPCFEADSRILHPPGHGQLAGGQDCHGRTFVRALQPGLERDAPRPARREIYDNRVGRVVGQDLPPATAVSRSRARR